MAKDTVVTVEALLLVDGVVVVEGVQEVGLDGVLGLDLFLLFGYFSLWVYCTRHLLRFSPRISMQLQMILKILSPKLLLTNNTVDLVVFLGGNNNFPLFLNLGLK